jgi:Protein of unknown function (DUF3396)
MNSVDSMRFELPASIESELTQSIYFKMYDKTITNVRPGISLVLYYDQPAHTCVAALEQLLQLYREMIPANALTARCGRNSWGKFTQAGVSRDFKELRDTKVEYTNIDLGSGVDPSSEGGFGWHFNGGNLAERSKPNGVYPDECNVVFFEWPIEFVSQLGATAFIEAVASLADVMPFSSGHAGYAFLHSHRESEATHFIGEHGMRFQGVDVSAARLANHAGGHVVNVSWLTLLSHGLVQALGTEASLRGALSAEIRLRSLKHGLLLQAGDRPALGDMNRGGTDLTATREVARVTRPLRLQPKRNSGGLFRLNGGTTEFNERWLIRFDD